MTAYKLGLTAAPNNNGYIGQVRDSHGWIVHSTPYMATPTLAIKKAQVWVTKKTCPEAAEVLNWELYLSQF